MIKKIFPFIVLGMMVSCSETQTKTNNTEVITELYRTEDGRILEKEEYQKYRDSLDVVIKKCNEEFDSKEIDY